MKRNYFSLVFLIVLFAISSFLININLRYDVINNYKADNLALDINDEFITRTPTTSTTTTTTAAFINNSLINNSNKIYNNSVIEYENNANISVVKNVYNYYISLPENVRSNFEHYHWKIIVVSDSLNKRFNYKYSIMGITVYKDKTIYIDNRISAASSIRHEMGHYINYYNLWADESDEFVSIFNEEKNNFINYTHALLANTNSTIEYFAEAYEQYIINSLKLKNNCPKTYEYIIKCSNRL